MARASSAAALPARLSRREREQAFRHRLILEAAEGVFATHGFERASVEAIASKAEIAIATLYKLFGSKEAIFAALIERRQDEFLLEVEAFVRAGGTPPERLARLVEGVFRYFEVHGSTFRVYLGATQGFPWRIRSSFGDRAFEKYQEFLAFVAAQLQAGMAARSWPRGDARRLAVAVMGSINGLLTHRHTQPKRAALSDDVAFATALVRRVAGVNGPAGRRR
jgi:AcrR family transcriptional regulator